MSSLLKKRIKDLTRKDLESLAKPLGVKGQPYPMRDMVFTVDSTGEKTLVNRLGVLEDSKKPLMVFSDREYADVVGMAMRDMVTPSMLPLFFDAIARRHPQNKRRIQFLKGAAGAGKTYMSELVGQMRTREGALKIDCTRLDMAELLFETVLDFNASRTFYQELDKRLAAGRLNPLSVRMLRDSLGEAFAEDEKGRVTIDWAKVGHNLRDNSQTDKKYEDRDYVESRHATELALSALRRVSQLEGLDMIGGNALGMATQEGALIRAFRDGREIILDEFNRCKKNTTGILHGVLQFVIGEIDQCTVHNTLKEKGDVAGQSFTFRRDDMRAGFFLTLTGNTEADGSEVEELPQALSSRIVPQHVPLATIEDWQHRICQMLTGIPVSTIYRAKADQWSANPDGLRKRLAEWRGLRETSEVPAVQMRFLRRWEDIVEVSEKLARFYFGWSQMIDPDSAIHRSGSLARLLDEIDDVYLRETTIDFRKIKNHIDEALQVRPSVTSSEDSEGFDLSAPLDKQPDVTGFMDNAEDPSLNFGTRYCDVVLKHIVSTTEERGKRALYTQLRTHAESCGLIDAQLHEGLKTGKRSVADLLNENPYDSRIPAIRAEYVRDLMADNIRGRYADVSSDNNDILQVEIVRRALDRLENGGPDGANAAVFNNDADTVHKAPLLKLDSVDSPAMMSAVPPAAKLATQHEILNALAAPVLRHHNLRHFWNKALSKSGAAVQGKDGQKDESLAMAENESASGLALTTVMVRAENKAVPLHLVWSSKRDRLLVVGEGAADKSLTRAFNMSGLSYVDRLAPDAAAAAAAALSALAGADAKKLHDTMKNAFLMRNTLRDRDAEAKCALHELLTARRAECYLPHYLVRRSPAGA